MKSNTPYIQRGDYVKAIDGHFKGQRGWVARIDEGLDVACVCWKGGWEHGIWVEMTELKRTRRFKNESN